MKHKITVDDLVRREVFACASYLVTALAPGQLASMPSRDLQDLCEQAAELCYPIDDWEEAAIQAGWKPDPKRGGWWRGEEGGYETPEECCHHDNLDPYQREIFEHWFVSKWLGEKLEAKGERVDFDFANLCVWGRTTTGQAIALDYVIEQIHRELVED